MISHFLFQAVAKMNSQGSRWSRREVLVGMACSTGGLVGLSRPIPRVNEYRIATFTSDVTIPIGHPCMGGGIEAATVIVDPLLAKGVVFLGADQPIVIVAIDWCEIRNDAYDRWRSALAQAVGTTPDRIMLSSVHQHDAPVVDLKAEQLLRNAGSVGRICDPEFHERAVRRVAAAVSASLNTTHRVTGIGLGKAMVDRVASNRRYLLPDGRPSFSRGSTTRDEYARIQPEECIDPMLRTLSFWDGDRPIAALHSYAVHPMSNYGQGAVSSDFVGIARERRQLDDPDVLQMYLSGCSGNVTVGKYHDGSPENREILTARMHQAMVSSWESTRRFPLDQVSFRNAPLMLPPRNDDGFTDEQLNDRLRNDPKPFGQCLAALGLSWRLRCEAGQPIDLPAVDFGPAQVVLLPGESYVEYQLMAQRLRPDQFIMALGYGECGTGYVPTEKAVNEHDSNLGEWCWVAPGAEDRLSHALAKALDAPR